MSQVFKLYACCFPVKGAFRSCIYDLQRKTYDFIPNALYDIIITYQGSTIEHVKEQFDGNKIIDEYFQFLIEKEYIFFCDEEELDFFPPIEKMFCSPGSITSAIIDIDDTTDATWNIVDALRQLSDLCCRHLQIRSVAAQPLLFYEMLLEILNVSGFKSIELIVEYNNTFIEQEVIDFINEYKRIGMLVVHSAPYKKIIKDHIYGVQSVLFVTNPLELSKRYRFTNDNYFNQNMNLFMEAHFHNPYFNRKVAIDVNGKIKNDTSIEKSFGNIKNVKLKDVVFTKEFQALWNVKKDQIEECKDCEFRYMCPDNRVPVKLNKKWAHTERCAYDPYTATWRK